MSDPVTHLPLPTRSFLINLIVESTQLSKGWGRVGAGRGRLFIENPSPVTLEKECDSFLKQWNKTM